MMKTTAPTTSNRQLKVGEVLRRSLIEVIGKDLYDPILEKACLTVTQVKVSPDLRQATVFIAPLFGKIANQEELLAYLTTLTPKLRYLVTNNAKLRHSPEFRFKFDDSFDQVDKLEKLLKE